MGQHTQLRELICRLAKSMFDRGLTSGSSGNISVRLADGGVLVTPTGTSFGHLDPAGLSLLDAEGRLIDGDPPTKEMPLHAAFYDTRSTAGAVVHLHSCHAVALSMLPDCDADNFLPPMTPYAVMRRSAVMLANHGPVVAGKDVEAACNAIEELEDTARLALMTRGMNPQILDMAQVREVIDRFDVEWDE